MSGLQRAMRHPDRLSDVHARARGLAVGEAPIPTRYGDEISHLNPLTYGVRVLRVLWRFKRGNYGV